MPSVGAPQPHPNPQSGDTLCEWVPIRIAGTPQRSVHSVLVMAIRLGVGLAERGSTAGGSSHTSYRGTGKCTPRSRPCKQGLRCTCPVAEASYHAIRCRGDSVRSVGVPRTHPNPQAEIRYCECVPVRMAGTHRCSVHSVLVTTIRRGVGLAEKGSTAGDSSHTSCRGTGKCTPGSRPCKEGLR